MSGASCAPRDSFVQQQFGLPCPFNAGAGQAEAVLRVQSGPGALPAEEQRPRRRDGASGQHETHAVALAERQGGQGAAQNDGAAKVRHHLCGSLFWRFVAFLNWSSLN